MFWAPLHTWLCEGIKLFKNHRCFQILKTKDWCQNTAYVWYKLPQVGQWIHYEEALLNADELKITPIYSCCFLEESCGHPHTGT